MSGLWSNVINGYGSLPEHYQWKAFFKLSNGSVGQLIEWLKQCWGLLHHFDDLTYYSEQLIEQIKVLPDVFENCSTLARVLLHVMAPGSEALCHLFYVAENELDHAHEGLVDFSGVPNIDE